MTNCELRITNERRGAPWRLFIILHSSFIIAVLSGCRASGTGDQANRQTVYQGTVGAAVSPPPAAPAVVPGTQTSPPTPPLRGEGRTETDASNNATQQSLNGLGLQMGKLGERVEGVHAELQASASATANVRAELSATINQSAQASVKADADLRAELTAQFQALAAGQAGISNRLEQTTQTISAGRDATTSTIQFTRDNADVLIQQERAHGRTLCIVVASLCGVLTAFIEASRRRAERRAVSPQRREDAKNGNIDD